MEDKCVAGNTDQIVMYMRYDCDAGMEAFEERWIAPWAHKTDLESSFCAQRASPPRH